MPTENVIKAGKPLGTMVRFAVGFIVSGVWFLPLGLGQVDESHAEEAARLFKSVVLPTLESRCYDCHASTATRVKGGLLLDRRAGLLAGGDTGPAIVPGTPEASLLIKAIRHQKLKMPPKGNPLADETIRHFEQWIRLGAFDSRDAPLVALGSSIDYEEGRQHWAFQPFSLESSARLSTRSIDGFIEKRLQANGLAMAPEASREDLIRRLSYDMRGLPPTDEERIHFLNADAPDAFRRQVDRWLASPSFGERQGQFWLDVVRYAESEGFEYDRPLPGAWRFRDYVIHSFNADKPFDRFVTEQLAGDELEPATTETLSAAVFHRLGVVRRNAGNPEIALSRNEVLTERTDVIGSAILGLTVGCARCHDHKFDPVSQRDYYQLQAFLAATQERNVDVASAETLAKWEASTQALEDKLRPLKRQQAKAEGEKRTQLDAMIQALESSRPADLPKIPTIENDLERATKMHVLRRGVWDAKGESVGMKPLDVFVGEKGDGDAPETMRKPRTQLARWLTADDHPLSARVIVNRIWQQYFGRGIVATANDFGRNGESPSHPELLDFLAEELVRHDWQLKPIHRKILLSRTYRQSARVETSNLASRIDPDNRLLWKHSKRRLTGEELRDSMLSVAGVLNDRLGGESVLLPVESNLVDLLYKPDQWQVTPDSNEHFRRSIYLHAKRNLRLPFMEAFDQPALLTSCYRRESSTHAPQALELLNGRISNQLAKVFAERLERLELVDLEGMVRASYRWALGREPHASEVALSLAFLEANSVEEYSLALFNLNEFLYVF